MTPAGRWLRRLRLPLAVVATVALLGTLGWFWYDSRVPSTYSVMDMGYADAGGGPVAGHEAHLDGVSVADLTGPRDERPAVAVTLTAYQEELTLASGERVDGYTLNHASPGPEIRARQGELVEVRLVNESVDDGVTLHWHGVAVPNAEDGVAGVTQDAVPVGGEHVYRFRVDEPGSYWYHSHQVSHEQVRRGLFGALVIEPAAGAPAREVVAAVHTYDGRRAIGGDTGVRRIAAAAGEQVRVRVINTDNGLLRVSVAGAPYRVVAIDARDVNQPTDVTGAAVAVPAGGRADLAVTVPADGGAVRVDAGAGAALVLGPSGAPEPPATEPAGTVDLLSYGSPAPTGIDPAAADRRFEMRIGRRPGFLDGQPGLWWTINGHQFPDVPMYLVREGDLAVMTIRNSSGDGHPMHLHGHHVLVLSRDGEPASGSPWWTDSLEVGNGETYVVAFRADNPGIWMDHCHQLPHAVEGLVTHLAYEGVSTPYLVGGDAGNEPE
jgi:FtsP/CotA-like multicopper oxidase with cupredoxin domain